MAKLLEVALNRGIEAEFVSKLLPAFDIPLIPDIASTSSAAITLAKNQNAKLTEPLSEPLSKRELQVLHLLDSALTCDEIGRELFVSVNTIRTHIRNIYANWG